MTTTLRHRALGAVFVTLLLVSVYVVFGLFTKKWSDYDEVTLQTTTIGLNLPERADVKVRGVIVGEVLDARSTGDGAELTLGLYPDQRPIVDNDVTGSIVPKTLFGEKYVSLVDSPGDAPEIQPGDTIHRTAIPTEVEQLLNDIYPLLRTVQPADLNRTLNALATALEGRGEQLGETLETADSYLKKINPQIPLLVQDLRLATTTADAYSEVLPQVSQILQNTIVTTSTLEDNAEALQQMLGDVTAFAGTGEEFLRENGDALIQLQELSRPMVQTLARYAPMYPCLLGGLDNLGERVAEAFRGKVLHVRLETLPRQPRAWGPQDRPVYEEDRGPACGHLPNPSWTQDNPLSVIPDVNDGIETPSRRAAPGGATARQGAGTLYNGGLGYAGGAAERDVLNELLAPGLGVKAGEVPDLGQLLVGPMTRGAAVTLE